MGSSPSVMTILTCLSLRYRDEPSRARWLLSQQQTATAPELTHD
jgi:hypothetical protein